MNKKIIILSISGLALAVIVTWIITSNPLNIVSNSDQQVTTEMLDKEGEGRQRMEFYDEELVRRNPLIKELPYTTEEFEVHYGVVDRENYGAFYKIILKTPNDKIAKTLAEEWIASRGYNVDGLDIEWTTE